MNPEHLDGMNDDDSTPARRESQPAKGSLTYPGVFARLYLSKDDGLQGVRRAEAIVADFAQMQADQTDEAHIRAFAQLVGITPAQAGRLLQAFFDGATEQHAHEVLKGVHVREAFLARHAECDHEGHCNVFGAGIHHMEVKYLPFQPISICLVVWLSLSPEALARVPEYTCHLFNPLDEDVLETGVSNVEVVYQDEALDADPLRRTLVIARIGAPILMHPGTYCCRLKIGPHEIVCVPFTVALRTTSDQRVALSH